MNSGMVLPSLLQHRRREVDGHHGPGHLFEQAEEVPGPRAHLHHHVTGRCVREEQVAVEPIEAPLGAPGESGGRGGELFDDPLGGAVRQRRSPQRSS